MTYALLIWMVTVQAPAPQAVPVPAPAAPTVIVQCPQNGDERSLRAQLDEARDQIARAREEASMPEHAIAALLVSDRPEMTSLVRFRSRSVRRGNRRVEIAVYLSPREDDTMVAVVLNLRNPPDQDAWEPKKAVVKTPFAPKTMAAFGLPVRWLPPKPAAVRAVPQRVLPGQSARIAVVFDSADIELAGGNFHVELLRDGKAEFEFELEPSDLIAQDGGAQ